MQKTCFTAGFMRIFALLINFKLIMMFEKIGNNAGSVWSALSEGELEIKALKKATKLTEKDLNLALGWLAREEKIAFKEVEKEVYISLA